MMDNQDYAFLLWVKEIEMRYIDMPKDQRIRVERWLDKLVNIDTNYLFIKERNMYAKFLLDMVFTKKLVFPFHTSPPEGTLPRFPNHLRHSLKTTVGAHETQYWRELYKRIVAADNPILREDYERSLERTRELEEEIVYLKSNSEQQEMKIEELMGTKMSLENVRVELSESLRASTEEISDLLSKLTAEEEKVHALDEELCENKLKLLDLADKVASESERNETLTDLIDDDRKRLEEIRELLVNEVAGNEILQSNISLSLQSQQQLSDRVDAMQTSIFELEAEVKERDGRLQSMQEVISSQKDTSTMLHTLLEESRLQGNKEAAELVESQRMLSQREHELIKCQEELQVEQSTSKRLEAQLERNRADHMQQVAELKHIVVECNQDREECRQELRRKASELAAVTKDNSQYRATVDQLKKELEKSVRESAEKLSHALCSLSLVRDELDECKRDLRVSVPTLTHTLHERDADLERLRKTETENCVMLERRLEETMTCSSDMYEKLNKEIADLQAMLQQREHELEVMMEHVSDVGKMLLEAEDMRVQLSSELSDTRADLESSQRQLECLQKSLMDEREKTYSMDSHVHTQLQDTNIGGTPKSAELISGHKMQLFLTECVDRNAEIEQQLRAQIRANDLLHQQLEKNEGKTLSLTMRQNEIQRLVEQRGRIIDELEAKLVHVEAARSESLNSCLTLAKENQLIERRYESLYDTYRELVSYSETMRQSLRVLEEARLKSVYNLEDLIENAFQDMMEGNATPVTPQRLK